MIEKYRSHEHPTVNFLGVTASRTELFRHRLLQCENSSFRVNPDKGDMLIFYYFPREGLCTGNLLSEFFRTTCFFRNFLGGADCISLCSIGDNRLSHASCPVLEGEKWTMTLWLHENLFNRDYTIHLKKLYEKAGRRKIWQGAWDC